MLLWTCMFCVADDPDWIVICPCGLDIEETVRELPPGTRFLMLVGRVLLGC
jgi:hypothetical protein